MQERVRPCAQSDITRHGAIDDPALNPGVVKPACHVPVFFEAALVHLSLQKRLPLESASLR